MYLKPIKMKCGHFADHIAEDVPFDGDLADVAACGLCFHRGESVNQPACAMADKQPDFSPLPEIKRDRTMAILTIGFLLATFLILIVSH